MRFGLGFNVGPFYASIPLLRTGRRRSRASGQATAAAVEGSASLIVLLFKGMYWLIVGSLLLSAAVLAWPWWVAVKVVAPRRGWSSRMAHGVGFGWTVGWLLVAMVLDALS